MPEIIAPYIIDAEKKRKERERQRKQPRITPSLPPQEPEYIPPKGKDMEETTEDNGWGGVTIDTNKHIS